MSYPRTIRKQKWTLEAICAAVGIRLSQQSCLDPVLWIYATDPFVQRYFAASSLGPGDAFRRTYGIKASR